MHLVNCNLRGADVTEACRASALWKVFEGGDQGRKVKCDGVGKNDHTCPG